MKELIIEVASLCPNRCLHCSSECGFVTDGNILFEEFKILLSAAYENGFSRIVFSGGEPLSFPLLPQFITYAKGNNFSTKVYTSASGDKNVVASLFDSNRKALPDIMVFSCYGDTHAINSAITGNADFFRNLQYMIFLAKIFDVRLELNFVPMKINYLTLEKTFFMFSDFIEAFNILRLVMQGNAFKNWNDIYISDSDLQPIFKNLFLYEKIKIGRSFQFDPSGRFKICEAGIKKICISSDGYILPCEVFKHNRFWFVNIHYINDSELRSIFKKLSSLCIHSDSPKGCLKEEVQIQYQRGI